MAVARLGGGGGGGGGEGGGGGGGGCGGNSFAIYWLKLVTLGTIRFWWKFRLTSLEPMLP